MQDQPPIIGRLSHSMGNPLPLSVCFSRAGFYLGTADDQGPYTRESAEYWPTATLAGEALQSGRWTQRPNL